MKFIIGKMAGGVGSNLWCFAKQNANNWTNNAGDG